MLIRIAGLMIFFAAIAIAALLWRLRVALIRREQLERDLAVHKDEVHRLRDGSERMPIAVESDQLAQLPIAAARQIAAPIDSAREQLAGVGDRFADYRALVSEYDAAVQYCLQPVELVIGTDMCMTDPDSLAVMIRHVDGARRRLFAARARLVDSDLLTRSGGLLSDAEHRLGQLALLLRGLDNEAGTSVREGLAVDIDAIVSAAVACMRDRLPKTVRIVRRSEALPSISGVSAQLQDALIHLLSNAARAMADCGTIMVETRFLDAERIEIDVADTGCGIEDHLLARIFDPFFTTRSAEQGTGLGLAVVRQIVNAHSGRIDVRTQPGAGTRFTISLPVTPTPIARAIATTPAKARQRLRKTEGSPNGLAIDRPLATT